MNDTYPPGSPFFSFLIKKKKQKVLRTGEFKKNGLKCLSWHYDAE